MILRKKEFCNVRANDNMTSFHSIELFCINQKIFDSNSKKKKKKKKKTEKEKNLFLI